jgi:hypothetical protein
MNDTSNQTETSRKIVENMYKSAVTGDIAAFFANFTDELAVIEPSFLPYGGTHRGIAGFQALFGEIAKLIDVTSLKIESLMADGEVVMAFLRVKAAKGGDEVQMAERAVVRNGKIIELKIYFHELGSLAAVIKR